METSQENFELKTDVIGERLRQRLNKRQLALEKTLPLIMGHLSDVISTGESPGRKKVWIDFENSTLEDIVAEFDQLKDILLESFGPLSSEEKNKVIETILYYMGLSAWEFSKQSNVIHQQVEKDLIEEINQEKQEKLWFESVVDSLPVGIVIVERTTGNILFVNNAGMEFAGGTYPDNIPPDDDPDFFCTDVHGKRLTRNELPRFRVARGEKLCGYELTAHYPGGQTTVVMHSDVIPATESHPERIVMAFQEIQDRKKWEEGRKAEVKNLREERSLREAFVAMLTHDLRTPLSVARMHTEMLAKKMDKQFLSRCRNVIIHIDIVDKMIQDLLDANKLKAGEPIPIQPCEMCLNDIVNEAVMDFKDLHGDRFFVLGEENVCGFWCGKAMRRMLDNLLSNAVKYGSPDSPVEINIEQGEDCTKMSVHNFGPAIPKNEQKMLFEPYKRATSENGQSGWGIGLSLVKGLVKAHHGDVQLESNDQFGTTFRLVFPNRVDQHH